MRFLTHTADEIDEKLKRIPLPTISEGGWERKDWIHIADQEFMPESKFAQSGVAIAAELIKKVDAATYEEDKPTFMLKSDVKVISDKEILAMFDDDD